MPFGQRFSKSERRLPALARFEQPVTLPFRCWQRRSGEIALSHRSQKAVTHTDVVVEKRKDSAAASCVQPHRQLCKFNGKRIYIYPVKAMLRDQAFKERQRFLSVFPFKFDQCEKRFVIRHRPGKIIRRTHEEMSAANRRVKHLEIEIGRHKL